MDLTDVLESRVERFAPDFKDIIEAKATRSTAQSQAHKPNYTGVAIAQGSAPRW